MNERITLRSILLGALLSGLCVWYTVTLTHVARSGTILSATQIPVMPYLLLIAFVAVVNPLLRALRFPVPFGKVELMIIFAMGSVSAGLSNHGLGAQLVPMVSGLFNRDWNTDQARWDLYVEPFVNEAFFVSEPGIREAAQQARDAELAWRENANALRAARTLLMTRGELQRFADSEPVMNKATAVARNAERALLQRSLVQAEQRWAAVGGNRDPHETVAQLPQQVEALAEKMRLRADALHTLEERAFDRVALFRKGLPDSMHAIPGLLPQRDEAFPVYAARLRAMQAGMAALRQLRTVDKRLRGPPPLTPEARTALAQRLQSAVDALASVARDNALQLRKDALQVQRREAGEKLVAARKIRNALLARRRDADASEFDAIDEQVAAADDEIAQTSDEIAGIDATIATSIDPRIAIATRVSTLQTRLDAFRQELETGSNGDAPAPAETLRACLDAFATLGVSWRQFFLGDVPWRDWLGPLARWGAIIFVTYALLMAFNVLIFRQWAHHERLIYPLAELSLTLGGADGDPRAAVPVLYRRPMFWTGFAVSAFVLGWNILATHNIIPGVEPMSLKFDWTPYIQNSIFKGLVPSGQHHIFFTLIGIAFLIPARISYSMWSFHLVYIALSLVLVWLGLGINMQSFEANMSLVLNYRTAIGGGALMTFATVILWKCRNMLGCALRPSAVASLERGERTELRIASALFLACSMALILLLTFGLGANLYFAILCYVVMMLVTIGMIRAVAEGGLFVFQCWFNPFHLIRSTIGMDRAWTSASLFAPLAVYYYVILWDIKAYIAPAMANALKIRDRLGMRRLRFHVALAFSLLVAAIVAVATHVIIGYDRGADAMHSWFYVGAPRDSLYGWIKAMAVSNPIDEAGGGYWLLAGVLVMAALLFFRRRHFWLPHPLGLVVWVNPNMWGFWFSFLIGWACKSLVNRYGNRETYHFFRDFFIGLIVGELIMCIFGVDLNLVTQ